MKIPQRTMPWKMIALSSVFAAMSSLNAQSVWNVGTGNWNDPLNWNPNGVPSAVATSITNAGTATVNSAVPSVTQVQVGSSGSGTLTLAAGGSLMITGTDTPLQVSANGGQGTLNQTG